MWLPGGQRGLIADGGRMLAMHWFLALLERLLGYVPVGLWRLYPIDPAHARRYSLPEKVPVPRDEWRQWRRGQRPERLTHGQIAAFSRRFLDTHPGHFLAPALQCFLLKAPLAGQVEDALRRRAWSEAEALLQEIISIDGADGRAHFLLALCLLGQERPDAVAEHLERAAPQMSADPDFHVAWGRLRELNGEVREAQVSYGRALELKKDHPGALERLTAMGEMVEIYLGDLDHPEKAYLTNEAYEELIIEGWQSEARTVEFFLERSRFHLQHGQSTLSLSAAERALELVAEARGAADVSREARPPVDAAAEVEALAGCFRALLMLERYADAAATTARMEQLAPESPWTVSCLGQLHWFHGDRKRAAAYVRDAIAADPNRIENLRLYLDPEFPRATRDPVAAVKQLLKRYPHAWAVKSVTASLLMASGDWDEAIGVATEAAEQGASDEALVELTGRMGREGRHAEVWRLVLRMGGWERLRGSDPLLRWNLATSFDRCGQPGAARELWTSLVEDETVHPELRLRARAALRPH
jgi:tetratricopeptide (TPR) repeat protein